MENNVLGDYTIVKQIGSGTLGTVFLAEHRFIKKQFVLKVLPEELSNDRAFIQRFEAEVTKLASLDHPHIVKVHNVSFADGHYFLVTDCIVDTFGETTTLSQYLSVNKQSLNENESLELLTQVASALDYAHGKDLVHRGIKLNNILIGKGERGLHVYLSDFGLSRIVGEGEVLTRTYSVLCDIMGLTKRAGDGYFIDAPESSRLSKLHASFLQTYHFLAPEQKIYRERPLGPSVDAYAFGVLAYFLIMRSFPEGLFPLPSKRFPDNRINWDDIIFECLTPDATKRPQSLVRLIDNTLTPKLDVSNESTLWNDIGSSGGTAVIEKTETKMLQKVSEMVKETQPKPVLKPQEIDRPTYEEDPLAVFTVDSTVAPYKPKESHVHDVAPIDSEMVVINGGEFVRGSNQGGRDERPEHPIRLNDFAVDVHPVTNEQFVRFLEVMGGEKDANNQDIIRLKDSRIKRSSGSLTIESGYNKHPVIGITWYGAVAYAKWVGKRIPTEAEWEIASRGGLIDAIYPTGINIEKPQANFFSSDTTNVMSYPANGYGLFDMAGNVYEWCQDWYDYNYYEVSVQEPDNPKGPLQGVYRVLRGGCWKSLKDDLRISHRHRNNPGTVNSTYGFRCAADVEK